MIVNFEGEVFKRVTTFYIADVFNEGGKKSEKAKNCKAILMHK